MTGTGFEASSSSSSSSSESSSSESYDCCLVELAAALWAEPAWVELLELEACVASAWELDWVVLVFEVELVVVSRGCGVGGRW